MQPPCKDCLERTLGCHSTCEKYLEYKEYRKDIGAKRNIYLHYVREYRAVRRKGRRR